MKENLQNQLNALLANKAQIDEQIIGLRNLLAGIDMAERAAAEAAEAAKEDGDS